MTCPDIYIGTSRTAAPPTPVWTNPAIVPVSTTLTEGVATTINVTAKNHGTDAAPLTRLQLYYADPSTGFMPIGQIGSDTDIMLEGAIELPPEDAFITTAFAWTPPSAATLPNGGHVCLLARLAMLASPGGVCMQQVYGSNPVVDPLQGIRNIMVVAPPPPPPRDEAGNPGEGNDEFMQFAFAATNTVAGKEATLLEVDVLDPKADRDALRALVADPLVDATLRRRGVKFAVPGGIRFGLGRERVSNKRFRAPHALADRTAAGCAPRLARTGPLSTAHLQHLLAPGTKLAEPKGPLKLPLHPGEAQQAFVQIKPRAKDNDVYAVRVTHTTEEGLLIGGLTIVFVPAHDYF